MPPSPFALIPPQGVAFWEFCVAVALEFFVTCVSVPVFDEVFLCDLG